VGIAVARCSTTVRGTDSSSIHCWGLGVKGILQGSGGARREREGKGDMGRACLAVSSVGMFEGFLGVMMILIKPLPSRK